MRCLPPLLGLLATACVGSAPPAPGPAVGTTGDASTTDASSTGAADTASPTTTDPGGSSVGSTDAAPCDPPCAVDQICIDGVCFDGLCDPSCQADQQCIDGVCVDPGTTTGEPPPECGLAVSLDGFPNPACSPCLEAACCDELQACFGDETTMAKTECLQLNNCIAKMCAAVTTQRELESCVNGTCAAYSASFQTWLDWQACAVTSCSGECT